MDTTVLARLLRSQATTQPAARPTRLQSTPGEFFGEIVKPQATPPGHLPARVSGARARDDAPPEPVDHLVLAGPRALVRGRREELLLEVDALLRRELVVPPRAPRRRELQTCGSP
jgi:hypothetical protein